MANNLTRSINVVYRKPRASIVESIFGTPRERIQKAQLEAQKSVRIQQQEQRKIETAKKNYSDQVISTIGATQTRPYYQIQDILDTLTVEYRKVLDDETIDNTLKLADPILGPRDEERYSASKHNYENIYLRLKNSSHKNDYLNDIKHPEELVNAIYSFNPKGDWKENIDLEVNKVSNNLINNNTELHAKYKKLLRGLESNKKYLSDSITIRDDILDKMGQGKGDEDDRAMKLRVWNESVPEGEYDKDGYPTQGSKLMHRDNLEVSLKDIEKYGALVDKSARYEKNKWLFIEDNTIESGGGEWKDILYIDPEGNLMSIGQAPKEYEPTKIIQDLSYEKSIKDLNKELGAFARLSDTKPIRPALNQSTSIPSDVQTGTEFIPTEPLDVRQKINTDLAMSEIAPLLLADSSGNDIFWDDDTDYEALSVQNLNNMISSMHG